MKKIFAIILSLISLTAFGQGTINTYGANPRTLFSSPTPGLHYDGATGIFTSGVLNLANIATLQSVPTGSFPDSTIAIVSGYYTPNDGGGHTFIWQHLSTAPVYQGMVIAGTGGTGRWIAQWDGVHANLLWFGVVGDGATDNTATEQLAFNYRANIEIDVPLPAVSYLNNNNVYLRTLPLKIFAPANSTQFVQPIGNSYTGGHQVRCMWFVGNVANNANDSGLILENINLQDLDTVTVIGGSAVEPNCLTIQRDTAFTGITGSHAHDFRFINCVFTGNTNRTCGGVFIDAYRNNFGGKSDRMYFDDCQWNYCYSGLNVLNTNTNGDTHLSDIIVQRPRFIHCGNLASLSNSFGVTFGGYGVRCKVIDPYFHDQVGVGAEFGGVSYSTLEGLRMDSSYGTTGANKQCVPYSFNNINGNGGGPGVGNTAINNKVLDSTNSAPYLYNQVNFTDEGNVWHAFNTCNCGSYLPGFASVKSSTFTNDIFWLSNSESNVIPFNFNSYGGTGPASTYGTAQNNTFTGVQFYGATGDKALIGFGDSAKNNRFVNCIYGAHPSSLVYNDGTAYNNYMDGVDSATGLLFFYGLPTIPTIPAVPTVQMYNPANVATLTITNNHVGDGTSITAGLHLSSPSTQNWLAQMFDSLGVTSGTNRAVTNSAIMDLINRAFTSDPATNLTYSSSFEGYTNNYGEDTSAIKQNAIREGARTLIANHFMDTIYAISNSAITKTGSWSNLTGVVSKSLLALSGNPMKSSTAGNTLTLTFYDNNVWIGTYGFKNGQPYGSFTVSIDGVLQTNTNSVSPYYNTTTFSGNNLSDQFASNLNGYDVRMPVVFGFSGLGTGAHTLIITLLQSVETDFDYIGKLVPPNRATAMLVMHMPYLQTPTGYTSYPIGGSWMGVDSINHSLDTVVNSFASKGYPIAGVHVNQYINNASYYTDGIHLLFSGNILMANAALSVVKRAIASPSSYPYVLTVRNADSTNADSLAYSPLPDTMVLKGLIGAGGTNVTVGPKVLYIGSLSRQVITTGTTATGPTGTPGQANLLVTFNFASTASTFTYTMPASPIDQQTVEFEGGGTLTTGNEITTLTLSGNSGQTIIGTALTTFAVGASAKYRWNSTLSSWLRILD